MNTKKFHLHYWATGGGEGGEEISNWFESVFLQVLKCRFALRVLWQGAAECILQTREECCTGQVRMVGWMSRIQQPGHQIWVKSGLKNSARIRFVLLQLGSVTTWGLDDRLDVTKKLLVQSKLTTKLVKIRCRSENLGEACEVSLRVPWAGRNSACSGVISNLSTGSKCGHIQTH